MNFHLRNFSFINRVVKLFSSNYAVCFFIISFISCTLIYLSIALKNFRQDKNKIYPLSFLVLFMSYYGLLYFSIAIRAGLALALLYLSLRFINRKNFILCLCIFVFSTFIQQSTIFAFPLLILEYFHYGIRRRVCIIILSISLIFYLLGFSRFTSAYVSGIFSYLAMSFPEISILTWSEHYADTVKNSEISLFTLYYIAILFFLVARTTQTKITGYTLYGIIGLLIYVFLVIYH